MCWNLWTFYDCDHKQAEMTQCGRRTLLCRSVNRDLMVYDSVCYNCNLLKNNDVDQKRHERDVYKADCLYWYVKGLGGAVGMRGSDYWRL
ncbi:hypothetical protein AA313_de0208582 [Arthrobotrys entomopaga]|nr:hypothetical protein AA313_de0208582 [Arthrobotrys entomopaga]